MNSDKDAHIMQLKLNVGFQKISIPCLSQIVNGNS